MTIKGQVEIGGDLGEDGLAEGLGAHALVFLVDEEAEAADGIVIVADFATVGIAADIALFAEGADDMLEVEAADIEDIVGGLTAQGDRLPGAFKFPIQPFHSGTPCLSLGLPFGACICRMPEHEIVDHFELARQVYLEKGPRANGGGGP